MVWLLVLGLWVSIGGGGVFVGFGFDFEFAGFGFWSKQSYLGFAGLIGFEEFATDGFCVKLEEFAGDGFCVKLESLELDFNGNSSLLCLSYYSKTDSNEFEMLVS